MKTVAAHCTQSKLANSRGRGRESGLERSATGHRFEQLPVIRKPPGFDSATIWFFRYARLGLRTVDPKWSLAYRVDSPVQHLRQWSWYRAFGSAGVQCHWQAIVLHAGEFADGHTDCAEPGRGDLTRSLSAMDAVSLPVWLAIMMAELSLASLTLWLLFGTTRRSPKGQRRATMMMIEITIDSI